MSATTLSLGLIARTAGIDDPAALVALRSLRLNGLRLGRLCSLEAFGGSLRELYLHDNGLRRLVYSDLAAVASSLLVLSVARNHISTLSEAGLSRFERLRILDASGNRLEKVAIEDLPLATLTVLDLRPCAHNITSRLIRDLDGVRTEPRVLAITVGVGDAPETLKYDVDGDYESIARGFCADYRIDATEDTLRRIVEAMDCKRETPDVPLQDQIEKTHDSLQAFHGALEEEFQATRQRVASAAHRFRTRLHTPLEQRPAIAANDLRGEHHRALTEQRRKFADDIRARIKDSLPRASVSNTPQVALGREESEADSKDDDDGQRPSILEEDVLEEEDEFDDVDDGRHSAPMAGDSFDPPVYGD